MEREDIAGFQAVFDEYVERISWKEDMPVADYDLIVGGVANDRVFNTCELYFKHYIDKNTALDRLKYEKPNQKMCIKNQQTIDKYLHFERSRRR